MNVFKTSFLALALFFPGLLMAQINKPSLSPRIVTEQQVGLATVKLDYGQPSKNGRKIFGGLIPYQKIWRTGANSETKVTFDRDVFLSEYLIPAGTYGLYSIPGEKEWTIILHSNIELWGAGGYDPEKDFLRFQVTPMRLADTFETLSIHFEGFHANGGDMVITWENTRIVMPLFVDSDAAIYTEIETKITKASGEVKAQTYFEAAQFYLHKDTLPALAADWFDAAIKLKPSAYWYVYYRAELAFQVKDYALARKNAEKCLTAAKASTSSDYGYIAKCTLLLEQIDAAE